MRVAPCGLPSFLFKAGIGFLSGLIGLIGLIRLIGPISPINPTYNIKKSIK